jgi:hypothetical protein
MKYDNLKWLLHKGTMNDTNKTAKTEGKKCDLSNTEQSDDEENK